MSPAVTIVLVILVVLFLLLFFFKKPPDLAFMVALTLMMVVPFPTQSGGFRLGILAPSEAFAGFANEGMLAVAFLFVAAAGIRETGAIDRLLEVSLGRPKSAGVALARLLPVSCTLSGFVNNTPLVAVLIAPVTEWANRLKIAPSVLLLPLSYSAILGGMLTLWGTSTNLILAGLAHGSLGLQLDFFSITHIGLPCALVGVSYLVLTARTIIPSRTPASDRLSDPREYTAELLVAANSPLHGRTVEEAGLRSLPGAYLTGLVRPDDTHYAVTPESVLYSGDRLVFAGVVNSIHQLHRYPGLEPATTQVFKLDTPRYNRRLYEAVIGTSSPVVQQTVREARFRNRYGAVILAIAREGRRVEGRLGDVVLKDGDTLLVEARPSFSSEYEDSRDFLLLRPLHDSEPRRREKARTALFLIFSMIAIAVLNIVPMAVAALATAIGMVLTGCCSVAQARRSVDWPVLVVIACAIGTSRAVEKSGLSDLLSGLIAELGRGSALFALVGFYFSVWFLTEILTNNAAAVLAFPIAVDLAQELTLPVEALIVLLMIAASSSFVTPFGYQTNLMVYGPGGYRARDYMKAGIPLGLLIAITALGLTWANLS